MTAELPEGFGTLYLQSIPRRPEYSTYFSSTTMRVFRFVSALIAVLGIVAFGCALGGVLKPDYLIWIGLVVGVVATYISYRTNRSISRCPPLPTINASVKNIIRNPYYITTWHDPGIPDGCTLIIPGLYYSADQGVAANYQEKGFEVVFLNKSAENDILHFTSIDAGRLHRGIQNSKKMLVNSVKFLYSYFNLYYDFDNRNPCTYLRDAHGLKLPTSSSL